MIKVLFLTKKLQNYRVPILNLIAASKEIELTVAHSGNPTGLKNKFKELIIPAKELLGFTFYDRNYFSLCSDYDVIVPMFYLKNIAYLFLALKRNRKYKLIYWGIGVRASLSNRFDAPTIVNRIRYYFANKADAMIFYSDYPIKAYENNGVDPRKLFVAHNTVEITETFDKKVSKDRILFIGTLYKEKNIYQLLDAYEQSYLQLQSLPRLEIVGDGPELENIVKRVSSKELDHKIQVRGAIYDEKSLEYIFKHSFACISPGQAGLSVLKSMGYGVPFITSIDAITGGERLNIVHNENGILYNSDSDLQNIILDIARNQEKYIQLGNNAKKYYLSYRTPEIMSKGFIDAVEYVSKNKNDI